jgi:Zn-dependent protease
MAEPLEDVNTKSGVSLFRLAGIQVTVHYSWLIIFVLILWSLSAGYLPRTYPGQSPTAYWFAGGVATVLFFLSVLAHEFSHSLMAKRAGIDVPNITLFVFGGVSRISEEASDPETELMIAVVGPLSSFGLALVFWVLMTSLESGGPSLVSAVFRYLAWINLALGVFNFIPGFPLDGGRVLRAVVWWKTGSLLRATRLASDLGKGFAVALMVLGAIQIFGGGLAGGLWLIFIGIFLRGVAAGSYQQTAMRDALEGVRVRDVMVEDVVTVSPDLTVQELIRSYFLHYGFKGFPVVDEDQVVGVISLQDVRHLLDEDQAGTLVRQVMMDVSAELRIEPGASLADALKRVVQPKAERLLVMEGDRMVGLITKTGLMRFVEIKQILEH